MKAGSAKEVCVGDSKVLCLILMECVRENGKQNKDEVACWRGYRKATLTVYVPLNKEGECLEVRLHGVER